MKVTIVTSLLQAEHLKSNQSQLIKSVTYSNIETPAIAPISDRGDFYNTTIEFTSGCDLDLIAQVLFSAGITYGLDLKYSSYDNEPSRVR